MSGAAIGDWRERAECATGGHDPELWYPAAGDGKSREQAVLICETVCPVQLECLAAGMREKHGIWGGKTGRERRFLHQDTRHVPADGARRRIRALAHQGWGLNEIAAAVERNTGTPVSVSNLRRIRDDEAAGVYRGTALAIENVYGDLVRWRSPSQRGLGNRARAIEEGWPSPEDWLDVDIDDPLAEPRPARRAA